MLTIKEAEEKYNGTVLHFTSLYKGVAHFEGTAEDEAVITASKGEMSHEGAYDLECSAEEEIKLIEDMWANMEIMLDDVVIFKYEQETYW